MRGRILYTALSVSKDFACAEGEPGAAEIKHGHTALDLVLTRDENSPEPMEQTACALTDPRSRTTPLYLISLGTPRSGSGCPLLTSCVLGNGDSSP